MGNGPRKSTLNLVPALDRGAEVSFSSPLTPPTKLDEVGLFTFLLLRLQQNYLNEFNEIVLSKVCLGQSD